MPETVVALPSPGAGRLVDLFHPEAGANSFFNNSSGSRGGVARNQMNGSGLANPATVLYKGMYCRREHLTAVQTQSWTMPTPLQPISAPRRFESDAAWVSFRVTMASDLNAAQALDFGMHIFVLGNGSYNLNLSSPGPTFAGFRSITFNLTGRNQATLAWRDVLHQLQTMVVPVDDVQEWHEYELRFAPATRVANGTMQPFIDRKPVGAKVDLMAQMPPIDPQYPSDAGYRVGTIINWNSAAKSPYLYTLNVRAIGAPTEAALG